MTDEDDDGSLWSAEPRIRPDWKRIRHWTEHASDARKSAEVIGMIAALIEAPGTMLLAGRDAIRFVAKDTFGFDPGWFWQGDDDADRDWEAEESANWSHDAAEDDEDDEDDDDWYDHDDDDDDDDDGDD